MRFNSSAASFALILSIFLGAHCVAAERKPIKLWPNGAPGDQSLKIDEQKTVVRGDSTSITSNVSDPTLTLYPAAAGSENDLTILVCPGGGYGVLAISHEGTDVCTWLNEQGISAALLTYRVPRRPDRAKHAAPLQDVQRAMTLLRANAKSWKLGAKRIGILGFSAGGHLSTMAITSNGKRTYPEVEGESRELSCVPDFGVLVYPAYLTDKDDPVKLSPEIKVNDKTPPTFVVVAHDDRKYVEGSARFYLQMLRNDRPCELHIFAKGGHGFGMRKSDHRVANWPQMALGWMKSQGIVK